MAHPSEAIFLRMNDLIMEWCERGVVKTYLQPHYLYAYVNPNVNRSTTLDRGAWLLPTNDAREDDRQNAIREMLKVAFSPLDVLESF